ncbi:MAG: hypothetical protein MRY83_03885, partial [Flavobacteriales bacterium]|nr:hypothetical protein [Flavobacteriales bacterium]
FFLYLFSCGQMHHDMEELPAQAEAVNDVMKDEPKAKPAIETEPCTQQIVGSGILSRTKDQNKVVNIFGFTCEPEIGEEVLILPADPKVEAVSLQIVGITPRDDFESGKAEWYEIEVQNFGYVEAYNEYQQPETRRWEYPFDLAVLFPVIEGAKVLSHNKIKDMVFPNDLKIKDITFAIDFNNDGLPNALIASFCCDDTDDPEHCEYTCGMTLLKKEGKWEVINESQPM